MTPLDLRVYVITTDVPHLGRTHLDVAAATLRGGARVVQLRDKALGNEEFLETARRIQSLTRAHGAKLIINDRVDVALALGADGIHVGRHDMPVEELKKLVPPGMVVGLSATSFEEAKALACSGADYLGVGPVYPTTSKDDATPAIGIRELARICREVSVPVVAIGGIQEANLDEVIAAGAAGAAVIAAVAHAPDMAVATAQLLAQWESARP